MDFSAEVFLGFRVVLQQNERFSQIEEKYKSLHGKTSSLFDMEEEIIRVSKKVRLIGHECVKAYFDGCECQIGYDL